MTPGADWLHEIGQTNSSPWHDTGAAVVASGVGKAVGGGASASHQNWFATASQRPSVA